MNSQTIAIISGVSGVLGVVSLIAYYVLEQRIRELRKSERSIIDIVKGEGLFDKSTEVIEALRQFNDETNRLKVLRELVRLAKYNTDKADIIYDKIKDKVDIKALENNRYLHSERMSGLTAIVFIALAVIAAVYGLFGHEDHPPPPPLTISRVELFDEGHGHSEELPDSAKGDGRPRHVLNELVQRSGNDFFIEDVDDFFFGLGFLIRGIRIDGHGDINARLMVSGLSADGRSEVWTEEAALMHKDGWKTSFDIPKRVTPQKVLAYFGILDGDAIPIAVVIECMTPATISEWSGNVQIRVKDFNSAGPEVSLQAPYPLVLKKSANLSQRKQCIP